MNEEIKKMVTKNILRTALVLGLSLCINHSAMAVNVSSFGTLADASGNPYWPRVTESGTSYNEVWVIKKMDRTDVFNQQLPSSYAYEPIGQNTDLRNRLIAKGVPILVGCSVKIINLTIRHEIQTTIGRVDSNETQNYDRLTATGDTTATLECTSGLTSPLTATVTYDVTRSAASGLALRLDGIGHTYKFFRGNPFMVGNYPIELPFRISRPVGLPEDYPWNFSDGVSAPDYSLTTGNYSQDQTSITTPRGTELVKVDTGDVDDDGVPNQRDNCIFVANVSQSENDGDGKGDACDNCPTVSNADQTDTDRDKIGDVCDFNVAAFYEEKKSIETFIPRGPLHGVDGSLQASGSSMTISVYYTSTNENHRGDIALNLENVSHEKGVAINWPANSNDDSPDIKLETVTSQPAELSPDGQSITFRNVSPGQKVSFRVKTNDFGAYGKLKGELTLTQGVGINGKYILKYFDAQHYLYDRLPIPFDKNENFISDQWEKNVGIFSRNLPANWDGEITEGQADVGDGLTLYEEYRGFMNHLEELEYIQKTVMRADGTSVTVADPIRTPRTPESIRFDPNKKDLVVLDTDHLIASLYDSPFTKSITGYDNPANVKLLLVTDDADIGGVSHNNILFECAEAQNLGDSGELNEEQTDNCISKAELDPTSERKRLINSNSNLADQQKYRQKQYALHVVNDIFSIGYNGYGQVVLTNTELANKKMSSKFNSRLIQQVFISTKKLSKSIALIMQETDENLRRAFTQFEMLNTVNTVMHEMGHALGLTHHKDPNPKDRDAQCYYKCDASQIRPVNISDTVVQNVCYPYIDDAAHRVCRFIEKEYDEGAEYGEKDCAMRYFTTDAKESRFYKWMEWVRYNYPDEPMTSAAYTEESWGIPYPDIRATFRYGTGHQKHVTDNGKEYYYDGNGGDDTCYSKVRVRSYTDEELRNLPVL